MRRLRVWIPIFHSVNDSYTTKKDSKAEGTHGEIAFAKRYDQSLARKAVCIISSRGFQGRKTTNQNLFRRGGAEREQSIEASIEKEPIRRVVGGHYLPGGIIFMQLIHFLIIRILYLANVAKELYIPHTLLSPKLWHLLVMGGYFIFYRMQLYSIPRCIKNNRRDKGGFPSLCSHSSPCFPSSGLRSSSYRCI